MTVPIVYRTDDETRWGAGKGSNLTASDFDVNFWDLAQAVDEVSNNLPQPDNIASITVSGTQMTVHLQSGTQFGPFPLPVLLFRWRGDWSASTGYAELDAFKVDTKGLYTVLSAHTSGTSFDEGAVDGDGNPLYYKLFGFSGASGVALDDLTDVALTGLTNHQILEYDSGSGLWKNVDPGTVSGLASLTDVTLTSPADKDVLRYVASASKWENKPLGTMADQNASAVAITGGSITGLSDPTVSSGAATKHYVDAATAAGLPSIADGDVIANISGASAIPVGKTLSQWFDYVLSNARGSVIFRGATGWTVLAPGTAGNYLKTLGAGADVMWDSPAGSGTVTSVASGTGLTGGPVTTTGTLALAAFADSLFLANISGGSAAPTPTGLSQFIDHAISATRGAVLYRGASGWVALSPGTSGKYLKTQGAGADPIWDAPAGSGTVTEVDTGTGLTGGPVTATGTISLAAIATGLLLANISGGSAAPSATALSDLIDNVIGGTRGAVLVRSSGGWIALAPGTSGQYLKSNGAGADPGWASSSSTLAGLGDVTVTGPADGQFLGYDGTAAKWENKRVVGADLFNHTVLGGL